MINVEDLVAGELVGTTPHSTGLLVLIVKGPLTLNGLRHFSDRNYLAQNQRQVDVHYQTSSKPISNRALRTWLPVDIAGHRDVGSHIDRGAVQADVIVVPVRIDKGRIGADIV